MPGPDAEGGLHYLLDTFKFPAYGEVNFYCRYEEYLWQVPVGVTSISAVIVGGGGGGGAGGGQCQRSGGGGGGLRWITGMPVSPGETLRIKVGHGGTGNFTSTLDANAQFWFNNPGETSYIASTNNSNVSGRTGIGGTIIVFAQGGGQFPIPPTSGNGSVEGIPISGNNNNQDVIATAGIGTSGGGGSSTGVFAWGIIGGGNGGHGGRGRGTGGGVSGAGGGAGGFLGNGGNGGEADANGNSAGGTAGGNGTGGAGGGGNAAIGGGANAGGGGGGVGMYWGIGANGLGANQNVSEATIIYNSWPGQGGSFGPDGKAPGNELYFIEAGGPYSYPAQMDLPRYTYDNGSLSNGTRGYQASIDDPTDENGANGSGGLYGGGGGGTDSTTEKPRSGAGACGVVRIIWAARQRSGITRNYPGGYNTSLSITQNVNNGWSGINTTNVLTNYGYPTLPPVAGGSPPITGEYYA